MPHGSPRSSNNNMDMIEYGIMSLNKELIKMNHKNNKYKDPHSTNRIGP
jgi:hypothetical protein